ncbi:YeeE/YedE thiosulfate transporter family protein [Roseibium porphyridii]|uniref:YeeE/YedE thiosulfate transporter family protein n=1 Tax=Roseibium porphyridii TaxID=2866279 RepID=A0ABY8F9M6_9HYPH|nr:YeeE/YedE thiosulfate transporter family protein [Roseibium sp. KMA01]WFE89945.1 YeeE/YedE thiosulfate transporter family protein [Roseibium sp. KMA01]
MTEFTPLLSFGGGVLIGLAAVALMAVHGRIAGINGIVSGFLTTQLNQDWAWRAAFLAGMVASPLIFLGLSGQLPEISIPSSPLLLVVGGFLTGVGTTFGSGCTSGHGVCGMSRLSGRSIVATMTFMMTAAITVYLTRHVFGG